MRRNQRRYLWRRLDGGVVHPSSGCTRRRLPARDRTSLATRPDLQTKCVQLGLLSDIDLMLNAYAEDGSSVPLSTSALTVKYTKSIIILKKFGAGDGIRTHDPNLGKVVLYP